MNFIAHLLTSVHTENRAVAARTSVAWAMVILLGVTILVGYGSALWAAPGGSETLDAVVDSEAVESSSNGLTQTENPAVTESSSLAEASQPPLSKPPVFKQSDFDLGDTIAELVLYLAVLCLVAAIAVHLLKRRMVSSGALPDKLGTHVRLLDRKVLSTRSTLHLVEVDGQQVLVCESANSQSMIHLPDTQRESGS